MANPDERRSDRIDTVPMFVIYGCRELPRAIREFAAADEAANAANDGMGCEKRERKRERQRR